LFLGFSKELFIHSQNVKTYPLVESSKCWYSENLQLISLKYCTVKTSDFAPRGKFALFCPGGLVTLFVLQKIMGMEVGEEVYIGRVGSIQFSVPNSPEGTTDLARRKRGKFP
jgi:hypothetical protein